MLRDCYRLRSHCQILYVSHASRTVHHAKLRINKGVQNEIVRKNSGISILARYSIMLAPSTEELFSMKTQLFPSEWALCLLTVMFMYLGMCQQQ